jgi:hypothetical protein
MVDRVLFLKTFKNSFPNINPYLLDLTRLRHMLKATKEHVIDFICKIVLTVRFYYDSFFTAAYLPSMTLQKALQVVHKTDPNEYTAAMFDTKGNDRLFPHISSITFKYANTAHRLESSCALELRSVIEELPSPTDHKCNFDTSALYLLLHAAYVHCQHEQSGLGIILRSLRAAPDSRFPTEIHVEQNSLLMSMTGCTTPFVDSETNSAEQNVLTIVKDKNKKRE